jgi:hypothetical protein
MGDEYIVRTPDGDRPYVHGDGWPRLIEKQVVTLPNGEQVTVAKVVKQPDRDGKGGVVEARADRSR